MGLFFWIGVGARIALSLVNEQANDPHIEIASLIRMNDFTPPSRDACFLCYHPKLFHYFIAGVFELANLKDLRSMTIVANLINATSGILWLVIMRKFIAAMTNNPGIQCLVFGFVALCPAFIVIQSQATNDAFAIWFGTLAIYFLWRLMSKMNWKDGLFLLASTILAASTKANGWVLFAVIVLVLSIKVLAQYFLKRPTRMWAGGLVAFVVVFLGVVASLPPYAENFKKHGNPLQLPPGYVPVPPSFLEKTTYGRPGILSVVDGLFTFRFIDMLATPYIDNENAFHQRHRTSLWSQLYGRLFFSRFDQWPPQFQRTDGVTAQIGRVGLVLGLFWTATLFFGAYLVIKSFLTDAMSNFWKALDTNHDWYLIALGTSFVLLVVKLTLDYRDYSWMKDIYIFPASGAFVYVLLRGMEGLWAKHAKFVWYGALLGLLFFGVDFGWLMAQLMALA